MKNDRSGFTLVELITALVLFGIVGTSIYQLLVNNQRVYRQQTARVDVNQSARSAISILPGEIRELSAGDPAGSDIVQMTASSLTYKAMRSLYFLCAAPNTGTFEVILDGSTFFGLRPLDATRDSIFLFAEGDPSTRADDAWLHANVVSTTVGTACTGGAASLTVRLSGVTAAQLGNVESGAPIRGAEVVEVLLYADAAGDQWLGGRQYTKASGTWTNTQPIVGPLAAGGLALTYYDTLGVVTAVPADVARIAITVQSQGSEFVAGTGSSGRALMMQDIMTQVALRNNPTY